MGPGGWGKRDWSVRRGVFVCEKLGQCSRRGASLGGWGWGCSCRGRWH